jgi:hypothetical protein
MQQEVVPILAIGALAQRALGVAGDDGTEDCRQHEALEVAVARLRHDIVRRRRRGRPRVRRSPRRRRKPRPMREAKPAPSWLSPLPC